jgi:hypothetical protein
VLEMKMRNHCPVPFRFITAALAFLCLVAATACAADPTIKAVYAKQDETLELDPASSFWRNAQPVYLEKDTFGKEVPGYRTEVRTIWTEKNIYFLYTCPYEELYLKPSPDAAHETNQLWNWDVAEVFIGSDFKNIRRYKEFEVSPQAEWIDLDIDLDEPHHEDGWVWNSGFKVATRIDRARRVWYAAMQIPLASVDPQPPASGQTFRVNLFRSQGPPAGRKEITWQPPMNATFHTPEKFGLLQLTK